MRNRCFTHNSQMAFAHLSGDYNPIHIDPIAARRLLYGSPIVHGVHLLLWALDNLLDQHTVPISLRAIRVRLRSPVRVGDNVCCLLNHKEENLSEITLTNRGQKAAEIQLEWGEAVRQNFVFPCEDGPSRYNCKTLTADQVASASGSLSLCLHSALAKTLFPNVVAALPAMQIAVILATTRLVGMECPGLHSIFSALELKFDSSIDRVPELVYESKEYDDRFSLLSMAIAAPGASGTIWAFLRPPPREQVHFKDLRQVVPDEFADQRALIVGGSRGLGEVTAKILAAGGAQVRITYYQSRDDAQRVVDEISAGGGVADFLVVDVLNPRQNLAERLGGKWTPTHLYYFATPAIFTATRGIFSTELFYTFCNYYVTGFLNIFQATRDLGTDLEKVYYPSSAAVEKTPENMGEYSAAKIAGEVLCRFLERVNRGTKIVVSRLPRLATDQTQSLLPVDNSDPLPYMLEELRRLRDA